MNFGSLFSFIMDLFLFSVMMSISSVETHVDRRRFVFSSVMVAYWASCRTNAPSSSHSSITSSYLDIYLYISMYIQDEYRRLCVFLFVLLFTVPVISYFLLRDVLLRLRVAEEFLFISARWHAYHLSLRLFIVSSLLSSSHSLHRLSPPTPRTYIRVVIFHVFIIIFLFVNLLPFFPLVTGQTWLR